MKTKLSEKNMANVMGKINTFFKKDVKEDLGVRSVIVAHEDYSIDGFTFRNPIVEEKQCFASYAGRCGVHFLYKERKEGKRDFYVSKDKILLAISTKWSCNCIPLYEGDTVIIKGTRMILKRKILNDYSVSTFVQMPVTKEERAKEIKGCVLDYLTWFTDDSMWMDMFDSNVMDLIHFNSRLNRLFYEFIETIDFNQASGVHVLDVDVDKVCNDCFYINNDIKFKFVVDMDAVKAGKMDDIFYIECEEQKMYDTYGIAYRAFVTEKKNNEEVDEEDLYFIDEFDCDYD